MTPEELVREAQSGELRPVYLFMGTERYLLDRAVRELRTAALAGGLADFNEDSFVAGEVLAEKVVAAARMVPMMAKRRFVLLRGLERWDGDDERTKQQLEALATYAEKPYDTTCLVLTAEKVDGRKRIVAVAKKLGFLVSCEPLDDARLARWVVRAAEERGATIAPFVAEVVVQLAGPELSAIADAVDRLALFVGKGGAIGEEAISEIVVKTRETSAFDLVNAVGRRDRQKALSVLAEVLDPREGPRLLGLLAWSVRQQLKFKNAVDAGMKPEDAAKAAGAPPFKARDLTAQTKALTSAKIEGWLVLLAEADLALKGSKLSPESVFETLVLDMSA